MTLNIDRKKILAHTPFMHLEEVYLQESALRISQTYPYYRIETNSWVSIFALTSSGDAILIEQPRIGMMQITLEVPGGGIDKDEEPILAAARELEEETGYRAKSMQAVGVISPNPAIMTNRLHMFLAKDCYMPEKRCFFPDTNERIEVKTLSLDQLDDKMKQCGVQNALSALTILMARRYLLQN